MEKLLLTAALALASTALAAETAPADKSGYTLFNPTPRAQMRELSTDRPDQTESPYTVDAGHWQIELDFATYTLDRDAGVRTETWNVAPVNVKLGLTNTTDLQVMFDSYSRESVRTGGATATTKDWGDLTLRLKHNLWGNDGGDTALALMPFVKIPLDTGDTGNDLHAEWVNTVTFSHDLTSRLGGYVEFVSVHSAESGADWVAQFDAGLTYAVSDDIQLDGGCNFGLTRSAPDVQPFLGVSLRF